jgi:hypothetical protein
MGRSIVIGRDGVTLNKKPSSAPADPYWSFVKFLATGQGTNGQTTLTDVAQGLPMTRLGSAQIVAPTPSKWGGGSLLCSKATNDGFTSASAFNNGAATGDYVIDFWMNLISSNASTAIPFDTRAGAEGTSPVLWVDTTQHLLFRIAGVNRITDANAFGTGTWRWVAVVRSAGTTSLYIDGSRIGTYADTNNWNNTSNLSWGNNSAGGGSSADAYFDDMRVTIGSNRGFTGASITIPTEQAYTLI